MSVYLEHSTTAQPAVHAYNEVLIQQAPNLGSGEVVAGQEGRHYALQRVVIVIHSAGLRTDSFKGAYTWMRDTCVGNQVLGGGQGPKQGKQSSFQPLFFHENGSIRKIVLVSYAIDFQELKI